MCVLFGGNIHRISTLKQPVWILLKIARVRGKFDQLFDRKLMIRWTDTKLLHRNELRGKFLKRKKNIKTTFELENVIGNAMKIKNNNKSINQIEFRERTIEFR